jgi:hypothetical protein
MNHLHFQYFNLGAVVVSALIQWLLGALWYSPVLFAKPWMALAGIEKGKHKSMVPGMISSFIGSLLLSYVLAHVVAWALSMTFRRGALVGFVCWVGFIAAPNFAQGIYESRPFKLFAINTGYWLVGLIITGGLLAVWR